MSIEDAREFVAEAWVDEELRAELMVAGSHKDEETAFSLVLKLAEEAGFSFNREQFRKAASEVRVESAGGTDDVGTLVFTLPREFSETISVGFSVLSQDGEAGELASRLPWLYHWSQGLDGVIEGVKNARGEEHGLLHSLAEAARMIKEGVGGLANYIEGGEKGELALALHLLETGGHELQAAARPVEDATLDLMDSDLAVSQSRSYRQIAALVEASRNGADPERCLEGLRMLIRHAEKASRTLNAQVRPMAFKHKDEEALGHYEQLSVILEYHLNGLRQLEAALFAEPTDAVDEILSELSEVDAYLLGFQEAQSGTKTKGDQ